jgi:hypothetical protein
MQVLLEGHTSAFARLAVCGVLSMGLLWSLPARADGLSITVNSGQEGMLIENIPETLRATDDGGRERRVRAAPGSRPSTHNRPRARACPARQRHNRSERIARGLRAYLSTPPPA